MTACWNRHTRVGGCSLTVAKVPREPRKGLHRALVRIETKMPVQSSVIYLMHIMQ